MIERLVISDTNILIDLQKTGLLEDFFALPFEIHTTDFVIAEITDREQMAVIANLVNKGCLIVDSITPEEMPEMLLLLAGNLSINGIVRKRTIG